MRTNYRITVMAAALAVMTLATLASAQRQFDRGDGIVASPKVRAQLDERKATPNTVVVATAPKMACPKCADVLVSVPVTNVKAGQFLAANGVPTQKISRHLCPACDTSISVAGSGKAKYTVANHTCSGCGAEVASCCNMKTSETATKGMDKKIEIAPIK